VLEKLNLHMQNTETRSLLSPCTKNELKMDYSQVPLVAQTVILATQEAEIRRITVPSQSE
jgi:hypothetical protein